MKWTLRDYQLIAKRHMVDWLTTAPSGARLLLAAPTGTGKSVIELAAQQEIGDGCWIITPRLEIVKGMIDKLGYGAPTSEAQLLAFAESRRITTPIRFRNRLLAGHSINITSLIIDEGHHDLAASMQDIHLLAGLPPAVALTASPYRGTPKSTLAMRAIWGEPVWIITYPEAVERGVLSFPTCTTLALVDDDEIEVKNGELVASAVESAYMDRLNDLAQRCGRYHDRGWDRPTMFSMPSRETAWQFAEIMATHDLPVSVVTGESSFAERQAAFDDCVSCSRALVQVQVVSEGVDLPIRRLIDASPCMSPVKWVQQIGRIMRVVSPGEAPPEYVCTNRNLLRHGYLLDGCLPSSAFKEAENAFGGLGRRAMSRAIGLEAIGRLQSVELPLLNGQTGLCYSMAATDGHMRTEYFVIVHPAKLEPIWAKRENHRAAGGEVAYGKWQRCEAPEDVKGFASVPPKTLSDKQRAWWKSCAARCGLDPNAEVTRKVFPALPVLIDTRSRV